MGLSTSPIHGGRGSGDVIFTPWCFMLSLFNQDTVSSCYADPLACFKYLFWNVELVNH